MLSCVSNSWHTAALLAPNCLCTSHPTLSCWLQQESHAVAGKPHDATINSDRYRVCWHFAGAISAGVLGQFSAQYKPTYMYY